MRTTITAISGKAARCVVWAVLVTLLAPTLVVLANAGPPPTIVLLTFDYQTSEPTVLEGVQLIGCDTPDCRQPTLLQQYGECSAQGCLDSSSSLSAMQDPECLENRCLVSFYSHFMDIEAVQVVAQFSDGVRESPILPEKLPPFGTLGWRIVVQDAALSVTRDENVPILSNFGSGFLKFYALTVATEVLVAILILVGFRIRRLDLAKGLAYVLLANLVSYPVTWFFWPSLGQFQPEAFRKSGYAIAAAAVVGACLLVGVSRIKSKSAWPKVVVTLGLLAAMLIFSCGWMSMVSYGNQRVEVRGLPVGLTILLAELFAVVFETAIVFFLARKTISLSLMQVALISVVTNLCSYLLGRLVLSG